MKPGLYIINSPSFPDQKDFDRFGAWGEWEDAEELPYLKSLCESEEEFEEKIIKPYEKGKETYYPLSTTTELPNYTYIHVKVKVELTESITLDGYVSIDQSEIVALTVWPNELLRKEVRFYRSDRLVAEDENPESVRKLSNKYNLDKFSSLRFSSKYKLHNGDPVDGYFNVGRNHNAK